MGGIPISLTIGIAGGVTGLILLAFVFLVWRYLRRRKNRNDLERQSSEGDSPHSFLDTTVKISQSNPELATEANSDRPPSLFRKRFFKFPFRQSTLPTVSQRHQDFQRQLSHKLDLSKIEFSVQSVKHKEQPQLGAIKPELYKQSSVDSIKSEHAVCGKLFFSLQYDHDLNNLLVGILRAEDLPAKDFSGTSDPYVKIYMLPERKHKFQTKVHRKTLNPEFNEKFVFNVPYNDISDRILQFSVYDFDRFSRHDLIGIVVVRDILSEGSLTKEVCLVKEILSANQEKFDLGEIMISLCYLPTAGRLTLTIVKARNLKAMDITGSSDPYVKVYLMCQGKRIKKKKTSVKKNTLNPVYNEAMVFDVPVENVEDVYLLLKIIDYDRIGSNEIMGCCALGPKYPGLGRDHWFEMLENPRKPVAQWYTLQENVILYDEAPNGKGCFRYRQYTTESSEGSGGF
ncbi:hypothetical protein CHS0354_017941 [Potamilus streckersoni]|uniref:C2 domain-containing protein n=1 Tax=Potamilus streckersoni TaxID=2493646 RepID=A0AAE0VL34_9BIVA|nr:hypothetical protein CHS0354_017941 [Potamilus streckersoni]